MSDNFSRLADIAAEHAPEGLRGILLDLGVSSMQIDRPERGFSYMRTGPLDMRMNGGGGPGAAEYLAEVTETDLGRVLREFGETRRARRIARSILAARDAGALASTADLRNAVEAVVGERDSFGELSKIFQAIRIEINDEMGALDEALLALPRALGSGGVAVVISYHSLEDRRVKALFRRESSGCLCPPELPICACGHIPSLKLLNRRPLRASAEEENRNPRARSARLRAARRI